MSKNLVIVESPAKARTIEKYLGPDFKVLASVGHIRKDTKVDKTTFDVTYEIEYHQLKRYPGNYSDFLKRKAVSYTHLTLPTICSV